MVPELAIILLQTVSGISTESIGPLIFAGAAIAVAMNVFLLVVDVFRLP
jgi:hypothetical protein